MASIDGSNSIFANTIDGLTNLDTNTITINGQTTDQLYVRNDMTNNSNISNNLNMGPYGITASSYTDNNFAGNKALVSDTNKKIEESTTTSTELGYLSGTTSNIQTQLNNRALLQYFNGATYISPGTTQGTFIQWNKPPLLGKTYFTCAKGTGDGGFVFEVWDNINQVLLSTPLDIDNPSQKITSTFEADFGSKKITTTYVPINNQDLTNKLYVDSITGNFVTTNTVQDINALKTFTGASNTVGGGLNRLPIAQFNYDGTTSDYLDIQSNLFKAVILDYLPLALNRLGGNVAIGKVPIYSSNYKLDVNGRIQCLTELLVENVGTSTLTVKSFNGRQEIQHNNTNALQNWQFGDLRIQHKDGFGVVDYNPITCDGNSGRVGINQSTVSTYGGALNIKAKTPIPTSYTGGLSIEPDTAGWGGSNAIDFIQNFAGGNTQFKIYPALNTGTGSEGQLRVKGFGSGTNPSLASDTLVIQKGGLGSAVGVNCEPNTTYGLDVVNDTVRCNDINMVNWAWYDAFNYGVALLCPAGVNTQMIFAGSNGGFGITVVPVLGGDGFQVNNTGIYEFTFSCWCLPFGNTQAIFAVRNTALATVKRLALIIDPVNGSTVAINGIVQVNAGDFLYVDVSGNVANINVFDRNFTIKKIKYV